MSILQLLLFAGGLLAVMALGYSALSGPSTVKEANRRLQAVRYRHSESTDTKVESQLKKAIAARKPKRYKVAGSGSRAGLRVTMTGLVNGSGCRRLIR